MNGGDLGLDHKRTSPMTTTHVIEFSVNEQFQDSEQKYESIVESIIDQFVPAVGLTTGTCPNEIAARLMIELAFQIGATHTPQSVLSLIAAATDAALEGSLACEAADEPTGSMDDYLFGLDCSPVKH